MSRFKIGVLTESFRIPVWPDAVNKLKDIGADGFQLYVVEGQMKAEDLSTERRKAFRKFVEEQELEISALCGDIGGFSRPEMNDEVIRRTKTFIDLAVDLGTKVVTTHIGVIPTDKNAPVYKNQLFICREVGSYAASKGVALAAETGPEPAAVMKAFLDDVNCEGVGVNLDPANLIMVTNDDPVKAVYTLKDYIKHTHAKDGAHYKDFDPVNLYESFAVQGIEAFDFGECFNELPLGEGQVDWDRYLNALSEVGYKGYLTIEREVGSNPEADIRKAFDFLKARI